MSSQFFYEGRKAHRDGVDFSEVPYYSRVTSLGTRVADERGVDWQEGWSSFQRKASAAELADAEAMDITKFRRKSNRYYA